MKLYTKLFVLFLFLGVCFYSASAYAVNVVSNIRTGQQTDGIRIVFDGTEKFQYDAFLLGNPNRLVIDLKNTQIKGNPKVSSNALISGFRIGKLPKGTGQRLVFELKGNTDIKRKFALEPQGGKTNWRLVIDLVNTGAGYAPVQKSATVSKTAAYKPNPKRQKIVVLDPGHGGKDPGAIGRSFRTYEKNITLSMGKELKAQLEARGFKVFMTRSTDIFIPLRQRVRIARNYHADLFISLHADSAANRNAQGLSIYTLSETASDKEAAALAERENKADIIDGMDFSDNSPEISDVLISLSQNDSRNKSSKFATYVVNEMKRQVKTLANAHRFAGFAVLKAPDIPSVLVELGYLSNYTEEKNLRDAYHRKKLGAAITKAVSAYFADPEVASSI